jgi:hypothetical protein
MKIIKLLLVITVLLLVSTVYIKAQDFRIVPKAKIEYDVSKNNRLIVPYNGITDDMPSVVLGNQLTGIGLDFVYIEFNLSFDNETYMVDNYEKFVFTPTQINFFFKFQYAYKQNYKVYVEHACFHPIISACGIGKQYLNTDEILTGYKGGYTKIGISYNY